MLNEERRFRVLKENAEGSTLITERRGERFGVLKENAEATYQYNTRRL
jgi:hypothetical protein